MKYVFRPSRTVPVSNTGFGSVTSALWTYSVSTVNEETVRVSVSVPGSTCVVYTNPAPTAVARRQTATITVNCACSNARRRSRVSLDSVEELIRSPVEFTEEAAV